MRSLLIAFTVYGAIIATLGVAAEVYYRRGLRDPYRPRPIRWPARPVAIHQRSSYTPSRIVYSDDHLRTFRTFTLKDSRWT